MAKHKLRVIPLGGLGEVGKNMMVVEYNNEAIIIDSGIMFPENDMLGIDFIVPDFRYLTENRDRLKIHALLITHGHEDHTGAIAHVLEQFNIPTYATRLTAGLIRIKLKNAGLHHSRELTIFEAGDTLKFGPFTVDSFHVTHSIPDCVGFGIHTPVGLLVHTGDYKFDHTPVDGWPTDFARIAALSQQNVLALLADSTNAETPGWTPSETVIDDAFDMVFQAAPGRILIATFASLISRIQQVANAADYYGRKMAVTGFSMLQNIKMARKLGYLHISSDLLISLDEAKKLPPREVVIMTTGSQGEPSAVLSRLSRGEHHQLEIQKDDTVILSAHPIPGNEEVVHRTINKLIQRGANMVYDRKADVHVSGHASQEEMKLMINLVRPRFFVPVHGELRHLHAHADLAVRLGIPPENIAVVENGTIIEFTEDSMQVGERVPGGYVFVDGSSVGDIGPAVLRDREALGRDGFVMIVANLNKHTKQLHMPPEIISRGFVYLRSPEAETLFEGARDIVKKAIGQKRNGNREKAIQDAVSKYLYNETKRRPMVFAHVYETD
jgi:ribonuclease J